MKKPNPLVVVLGWSAAILALFALNQFVFGHWLEQVFNPRVSGFIYVLIRAFGLVYLGRVLVMHAGRNRFQVLSTVLFIGMLDQVAIKGAWILQDMRNNPAAWQDFHPTNAALFVNLATGYLFMVPVVLILSFFGMESTRIRRWKVDGGVSKS